MGTPNGNSNALGLVEFVRLHNATRIIGDRVTLSEWMHGCSKPLCLFGNGQYGFTAISGNHFKMGYGRTFTNEDYADGKVWLDR